MQEVIAAGLGSSSFSSFGSYLALIHGTLWEPGRGYYWEAKVKNERRETRDERRVTWKGARLEILGHYVLPH